MASENTEQAVILLAAAGVPTADLARRFGYTPGGMAGLVESLKDRISEKRSDMDARAILAYAGLYETLEQCVTNIRRVVNDPDHRDNIKMSTYVVDKFAPTVQIIQSRTEVAAAPELIDHMSKSFAAIAQLRAIPAHDIESDPHVMQGAAALPVYDVPPSDS
jgi:hypothetical protein